MIRKVLYVISVILFASTVQCAGPPKLNGSYIAWGEITQPVLEMGGVEFQAAFQESSDEATQNAAFVVWMNGQNVTFIKNYKTNQTFKYTDGKNCELTNETEWVQSDYPPGLLTYENDDGTVKFSIRQLVDIPEKFLVSGKSDIPAVYRGVPARMWQYEILGKDSRGYKKRLNIYSYWSDGTWNTSSNEAVAPLGFVVAKTYGQEKMKNISIEETVTNVFGFISGAYDHKYFEPVQGVICPNREQTIPFPAVQNIKAIAIHSEMVLPDYQEIRYIDTYFDPRNQLVRMDLERLRDEDPFRERKTRKYESEVAIGKSGVVFHQEVFENKFSCQVIPFTKYQNDLENLFDITQDLKKWKMGKLFGVNDTSYVYTGKTVKGDVPCHVFQGIRTDWPEASAKVTSLWEWCFNINMSQNTEIVLFLNDEVGLINLQITILSERTQVYGKLLTMSVDDVGLPELTFLNVFKFLPDSDEHLCNVPERFWYFSVYLLSGKEQEYPPGFRMYHHFYEVTARDPDILDATKFDISRCFEETEKRAVQFYLDLNITKDNLIMAENLTSDVSFLQKWKQAIYKNSHVPSYSLRIAKLTSTIADKKLYIKFLILANKVKISPTLWADQPNAIQAELNLRGNINQGTVSVPYITKRGEKPTNFTAAKHSVTLQINTDFEHHTLAPVPMSTATPSKPTVFSLRTEPDDNTGTTKYPGQSTTPSDNVIKIVKLTGHQPGAVAGVSIAMLLAGISVGAAGTFYKFYGLPSCGQS